ncbi:dihydroxyacetone kinase phosphoryl donor subunit DhaM [Labedaea rhizosphaerae]|uniref:Phosphocarrier protein HPr n=1 Tax=Labedaea rhizosphaerae TaxID=598644 RepID=A0A4R6SDC2_LABRH|nr:dihydroxyacetone kinase phosphoryl donor subunit DhaM [Labedaea rhizosphaerae]TDP97623.1 phosphocarrier protein HPr /dihydroxyacetone kinase DhaM subunit [Labedaea rhizosphaerae]
MTVGLVIVSHSAKLAEGVAELAGQMAPDVAVRAAGGANGGLGTDFEAVTAAIEAAQSGAGVVVLFDLGSAQMVADMAAESVDGDVRVVDAPLVEGAVAAAVAAQGGGDVSAVAAAAEGGSPEPVAAEDTTTIEVVLTNEIGLHARPAATLARELTGVDATVTVRFGAASADARSVLGLLGLGARGGDTVSVSASGPAAQEALDRVRALAERNFDE